jgi:peptidoglycan/xylan/chitin deacetylase (PgdA/CDA1 family)
MATIPLDVAQEELEVSKRAIEKALAEEIVSFAYPSGNHNAECRRLVADSGFQLAFSTEAGLVGSTDDRFTIKRINIHQGGASSVPLLMATIVGIL